MRNCGNFAYRMTLSVRLLYTFDLRIEPEPASTFSDNLISRPTGARENSHLER